MNKCILLMLLCLLIGCRNQGNDVVIKDVDDVYFYLENKQNPEKAQLMARIAYELNRENYKEAEKYFLKVAKYDKTAYVSIADMYYEHIDENEGKKRYEIAFEKGNKKAGTILGMIAEDNNDYKKAEEWYKKSLDKENVLGYKSFATFLYKTNRKNEAEKYFIEAGNRKDADSMLDLIKIYYMKKDNEKLKYWQDKILNTKEIFRFDDEANDLLEYSLSKDRMDKEFFELYIKGEESILKKDYDTAEKYFLQMEKLKKEGILYTADFYYRYKDEKEKGMEKYKKAYENGLKKAAVFIGIIEHRNRNIDEAKKWYRIAANAGYTDSQIYLAQILEEEGYKLESFDLYLKAAELKDYRAINYLLKYYYREKNLKEIKKWIDVVKKSNGLKNYSEADSGRIKEYAKFLKEKE
ncbi:Sel1 repeat protein [Leptotrichia sp. oral taxon 879]|uniref:Sel1 repeat protein n=1 Tax=Leptotrichia sp. oral taxon 879 TaxID=1227267 RepID=UPI0003AE149C|nr:Sel1 repeat protein [Leptotrichia sp. oral taxon 879]ERK50918.1 Sel1 repeat protein [Leptotrichia sp. oral taxon 879 str. F0557]